MDESIKSKEKIIEEQLKEELNNDWLATYTKLIDGDYKKAIINRCSDFTNLNICLLHQEKVSECYRDFKVQFPYCHFLFATMVSSQNYTVAVSTIFVDANVAKDVSVADSVEEVHQNDRMILLCVLGLLHTRSQLMLHHWAMIAPLGHN